MNTFLQIFLLINVFLMGMLATVAIRHAYAHFRPHSHDAEKKPRPPAPKAHLSPEVKAKLLEDARIKFQAELEHSASDLQRELQTTTGQLNKQLEKLGTEIVSDEMKRYHASIDQMRQQANTALSGAQSSIAVHQAELEAKLAERQTELEAKLAEQIAGEQQRLIQQIDTKLADAVASFLSEALQHNVDLGAQSPYLTALLEEHKADFKREVNG